MALVGFAGPGGDGVVRLYPDINYQRWLDVPRAQIVAHTPLTTFNPGRPQRTVLWVDSDWMLAPVFQDTAVDALDAQLVDAHGMSVGPLLPGSRFVAAQLLDLIAHLAYEKKDS
jgi:hypothetical protein